MDGSMTYARGGAGIFAHDTGPYAGPTPTRNVLIMGDGMLNPSGFAGFGAEGDAAGPVPILSSEQISAMVARDVAAKGYVEDTSKTLTSTRWPTWKVVAVGGGLALFAGMIVFLAVRDGRRG